MAHRHNPRSTPAGIIPMPLGAQQPVPRASKSSSSRANAPRLKFLVRRLPPGLTQAEFEEALGSEWAIGRGKVDWVSYKPGKLSADPSKPSKPSRAYIRVTSSSVVNSLSDRVRQTSFHDSRNTFTDPALLGPPTLEYAPYPRAPGLKIRKDARMGTIDQDLEFIAFLESLTNPVSKPNPEEILETEREEKSTVTPLIQFLREKKANKAKETSVPARTPKPSRAPPKDVKAEKAPAKKAASNAASDKQAEASKAAKDAVKAAYKQMASQRAQKAAATPTTSSEPPPPLPTQPNSSSNPALATDRKRERGDLTAATKILRRDLGLTPPRKRGDKVATTLTTTSSAAPPDPKPSSAAPTIERVKSPAIAAKPSKEEATPKTPPPKLLRKPPTEPAAARNPPRNANPVPRNTGSGAPKAPATQTGPTQAFLKHANPSQGVTESLLNAEFSKFGKILNVEIDKKKGFGYVDFEEPESLKRAIQASPVQIAQSGIVVLERRSQGPSRGNHLRNHPTPPLPPSSAATARQNVGSGTSAPARTPPHGPRGGGRGGPRQRGGYGRGARGAPAVIDRSNNTTSAAKPTATTAPAGES